VKTAVNRHDQIREVALKLFLERGYGATSIRDIAAKAGINSATLYHYFPRKQDILLNIVSTNWNDIFREVTNRLAEVHGSWTDRLHTFVAFHVEWHCLHGDEMRIVSSERRSIEDEFQARVSARRNEYEGLVRSILAQGAAAGEFQVTDLAVTSFAILQMLTGIAQWYRPGGRLTPGEVSDLYWGFVQAIVRTRPRPVEAGPVHTARAHPWPDESQVNHVQAIDPTNFPG
jgi:AcrR family transcriptional regulator